MQNTTNYLKAKIIETIKAQGGKISFADFMQAALYTPNLGFYSNSNPTFGAQGAFITAPELSPLFGQTLALEVKNLMRHGSLNTLLEFGAGSGKLALSLLLELEKQQSLPEQYIIIELSGSLREAQQLLIKQKAPGLLPRVTWYDSLPDTPINGIILANEVLDAMPVNRFQVKEGDIKEIYVAIDEKGELVEILANPCPLLEEETATLALQEGYHSEVNLFLKPWLKSCYDALQHGVVILIDYGFSQKEFYHPDRSTGTLMCHYQHRAHTNPYLYLGEQDITAHVNFTQVANHAYEAGFNIRGYTNQASYLLANDMLSLVSEQDGLERVTQTQAVKKLTLPHEMGEIFKVMALEKGVKVQMNGFSLLDLRARL
jgi:SAM-dependent MidA family methyltransferase